MYHCLLCRTISCRWTCKPILATWYGPSYLVCGGHPSWPLEVTGNSGFFKLVHCGNLWLSIVPIHMHCVQVETLRCPTLDWGGHSLLQIFLMTQSLDASVSSLMYVRLIGKSVSDAELYFLSFCTTLLNSSGWNSFLTRCPLCLLAELLLCVQYNFILYRYCFC